VADPYFRAEADLSRGPRVALHRRGSNAPPEDVFADRGCIYLLGLDEARALAASLTEAIRQAEAAQVPAGTVLTGVSPCYDGPYGKSCGRTKRLVIGYGHPCAGMLTLECPRCGERSVMQVDVAQGLIAAAKEASRG
jgi:hypothetical protein